MPIDCGHSTKHETRLSSCQLYSTVVSCALLCCRAVFPFRTVARRQYRHNRVLRVLLSVHNTVAVSQEKVGQLEGLQRQLMDRYDWSERERSDLQEQVHSLLGNIRVFCRVRNYIPGDGMATPSASSVSSTSMSSVSSSAPAGAGAGRPLPQRKSGSSGTGSDDCFAFPDAGTKGAEIVAVHPPAAGVDGVLRESKRQPFMLDRYRKPHENHTNPHETHTKPT